MIEEKSGNLYVVRLEDGTKVYVLTSGFPEVFLELEQSSFSDEEVKDVRLIESDATLLT